jgi:hypothetical protein
MIFSEKPLSTRIKSGAGFCGIMLWAFLLGLLALRRVHGAIEPQPCEIAPFGLFVGSERAFGHEPALRGIEQVFLDSSHGEGLCVGPLT